MKEILEKVLNTLKRIGKEIYFFGSSQVAKKGETKNERWNEEYKFAE